MAGNSAVNGPLGAAETWTAIRFTTGAGNWQFNSLIARFADQSSGGAGLTPDMLKIEIQNDIAGNPGGTLLGTLTSTADITAEANYGFSPTLFRKFINGGSEIWRSLHR